MTIEREPTAGEQGGATVQPPATTPQLNTTEAAVYRVLSDRGSLDEYQISSGSNLGLKDVESALHGLLVRKLVAVQQIEDGTERFVPTRTPGLFRFRR